MRFPTKIILSCNWVAIPVELIYVGMPVVRTDGRWSAVGVRSRDSQIFRDENIYLPRVLRWRALRARNSSPLLIISHITFRDCRVHIFSHNLSRNSFKQRRYD